VRNIKVDVVATSSVIPPVEFQFGIDKLSALGFELQFADNLLQQDFAYAGTAKLRANAFYQAAMSDSDVVWAVRGGYGASQLLTELEVLSAVAHPKKKKILIGYSDLTALYQFVSDRWGWEILHAPMLASKDFHQMRSDDEQALLSLIKGEYAPVRYQEGGIKWLTANDDFSVTASLSGGNLAVICSMIGTPWQLDFSGKLLFLEEIGESWCKIERMLQHLLLSGALKQCKGIVLGEFTNCFDTSPKGLKSRQGDDYCALRTAFNPTQALEKVFCNLAAQLDVPIGYGLAVGHCSENAPLALFKNYRLSTQQGLERLNDDVTVAEFL